MTSKYLFMTLKSLFIIFFLSAGLSATAQIKVDFDNLPYVDDYYTLTLKEIEERADAGDPFAQTVIADNYVWGVDAYPYDEEQADVWRQKARAGFEQLAEKGNAAAQYKMGAFSRNEKDWDKALVYYKKSAEQGYTRSQIALGDIYRKDKDILNPELADMWYQKALPDIEKKAQQGDRFSCGVLSNMYRDGFAGKPVDEDQAQYWQNKVNEGRRQEMLTLNEHALNPMTPLMLIISYMHDFGDMMQTSGSSGTLYGIKIYVLSDLLMSRTNEASTRRDILENFRYVALAVEYEIGEKHMQDSLEFCRKTPSEACY